MPTDVTALQAQAANLKTPLSNATGFRTRVREVSYEGRTGVIGIL